MKFSALIVLTLTFVIGCTGGGGGSKSAPAPQPAPPPKPPPKPEPQPMSGVQRPRQHSVEIESENFKIKVTNIGWCDAKGGISRPNPCHYHDYTKIEYQGKVGYLYRELLYDREKEGKIEDVKIEPNIAGMDALWAMSDAKWQLAQKEILPLAREQGLVTANKVAFKHGSYWKAEQLRHRLATDACRALPVWKALRELTPDKQGNLTITVPGMSYLDDAVRFFQTAFELGADGKPLTIVTEFDDYQRSTEVKRVSDMEAYVSATIINPAFARGAINPRVHVNTSEMRSACSFGYRIKLKIPSYHQTYVPYREFWPPYNEAVDDAVSDYVMRTNDYIFKRGYRIAEVPRYGRQIQLKREFYLQDLPLIERILPQHLEEYRRAYPQPFSEKDFE